MIWGVSSLLTRALKLLIFSRFVIYEKFLLLCSHLLKTNPLTNTRIKNKSLTMASEVINHFFTINLHSFQWGSISRSWHHQSRLIVCCVFYNPEIIFNSCMLTSLRVRPPLKPFCPRNIPPKGLFSNY